MSRRRIEALRRLAERPGTEAEGRVAAEMLARHEAKGPTEADLWDSFRSYLRTGSNDDLADAMRGEWDEMLRDRTAVSLDGNMEEAE